MKRRISALIGLAVIAASALPAMSASAASVQTGLSITVVNGTIVTSSVPVTTPEELSAFEASNIPKVITIDTVTNRVVSVTQKTTSASPAGVSNPCAVGALCWAAAKAPYANFGFAGVGTYRGTWHWRGTMNSNNWGGVLQYYLNAVGGVLNTTPAFGHGATISFSGGVEVIGVLVGVNA